LANKTLRDPLKYIHHIDSIDGHPLTRECNVIEYDDGTYVITNFTSNTDNVVVKTSDPDVIKNSEKEAEEYAMNWTQLIHLELKKG
jgi:hypothetical protein